MLPLQPIGVAQDPGAQVDSLDAVASEDDHRVGARIAHGSEELPPDRRYPTVPRDLGMKLSPHRASPPPVGIGESPPVPESQKIKVGVGDAATAIPAIDCHAVAG